jgi:hypothetical protein
VSCELQLYVCTCVYNFRVPGPPQKKPQPISGDPRITRLQAARRFNVSADTITSWWEEGRLRGVDLNAGKKKKRDLRFSDDDIDKLKEELYRQSAAEAAIHRSN